MVDTDFEVADVAAHHVDFAFGECARLAFARKDVEPLLDLQEERNEVNKITISLLRGNRKGNRFRFEFLVENRDDQTVVPHRETDELWIVHSHPRTDVLLAHPPVATYLLDSGSHHEVPAQKVFGHFGQLLGLERQELQQEYEQGGDWAHELIVNTYRGGCIISIRVVVGLEIGAADFGKPDVAVLLEGDGHQIGQFKLAMEEVCSIIIHIG